MSTYVMSDLHGMYREYQKMLNMIEFKENDMLYILGDIVDRGPNPIKIILDIMNRPNIEVIAGNHCSMALECLNFLLREITQESIKDLDYEMVEKLLAWQGNGGVSTSDEFHKYDRKTQKDIVEFISEFELYDEIEVNGKTFILIHAGLGNFSPERELWDYELDELVWHRPDYSRIYFEDKYVITGHSPTVLISNNPRPGYICQMNNHIAIDCGCCFKGGRLGCIRLEDMKEFYVEREE